MIQNKDSYTDKQRDYGYKFFIFVIVFFLASVGFPSFRFLSQYNFLLLPIFLYIINKKGIHTPKPVYIVLLFIAIFSIIHFYLGHLTFIGCINLVLTIAVALYTAVIMERKFLPAFVSVMKFFAFTSTFIWIALIFVPELHSILSNFASHLPQMMSNEWVENNTNKGTSLYIYYLPTSSVTAYTNFIRNNGPFYEPGLFASYLNIALVFNICVNKKLLSKDNIVLILAILSTCSSAGYISFILIVIFSAFMQKKWIYKIITLSAVVFLWRPVMNLDFMANKIMSNYDNALTSSASRFGAILYHLEKVKESPIIGYAGGIDEISTPDGPITPSNKVISPNGLSYPFVFWGIPLAILFYFLLYDGFKKLTGIKNRWILLSLYIVILSTAFSQTITTGLIILTITSLSFTIKNNYYENSCC